MSKSEGLLVDRFSHTLLVLYSLAGANGVGKTTFTKLITGELESNSGVIEVGETVGRF